MAIDCFGKMFVISSFYVAKFKLSIECQMKVDSMKLNLNKFALIHFLIVMTFVTLMKLFLVVSD